MKFDKRLYIIPAIFVVFMLWFPFYNGDSSVTIDEIKEEMSPLIDMESYYEVNDKELKKYFNITASEIEGYLGYKAKDTMSAETLLIIRLKDQDQAIEIKDKVQKYIQIEHKKYDGYNVNQVRILDNYTMIEKKGYVFLSIVDDHDDWKQTFQNAL